MAALTSWKSVFSYSRGDFTFGPRDNGTGSLGYGSGITPRLFHMLGWLYKDGGN